MANFRKFNKAELLEGDRVRTPWFRVAYPEVFEPQQYKGKGEYKYSVTMLFDEEQVDLGAMRDLATAKIREKFGSSVPKKMWNPFRSGTEEKDNEDFEGMTFIRASSKFSPGKIDQNCSEITDPDMIYSGCYMRATLSCYAFNQESKGVAFGLQNLQLLANGQALASGATSAAKDFGAVSGDEPDENNGGGQPDDDDSIF